ncbi:DNA translocase FtsK [Arcobacter sp. 15-2]|uniref:DNA translocase FtsK n=1 Tax=Arcobacter sp. 15-2 TaxID=3374109 RepID=UPI00399D2B28
MFFLYVLYKFNFYVVQYITIKVCSVILLFISLILFQSLIVEGELSGKIGDILVSELSPFVGLAGLWIFVIIGFILSFVLLVETDELFSPNTNEIKEKLQNFFKFTYPKNKIKSLPPKLNRSHEQKVMVKEVGDTAEIYIEEEIQHPVFSKIQEQSIPSEKDINNSYEEEVVESFPETVPNKSSEVFEKTESIIKEDKKEEATFVTIHEEKKHSVLVNELEENKKILADIEVGDIEKPKDFQLPSTTIFQAAPKESKQKVNEAVIDQKIKDLLEKLKMFKIDGDVVRTYTGPIVTTFEFKPAPNVKVSKILNLQDDLAMALKAQTIRIQAPIPGKDVVGIEVPNEESQTIYMREVLESELFTKASSPLTMILGKDIVGNPFITDLKKLPHLLIAGTTGSGKSVGLNAMILSLLYKNSPDTLKLIMIDPKMIEFSIFNDIPHLLTPVITKPMEAINALANMVVEMERRYVLMADSRTKNIENFNEKAKTTHYEPFPYIVIVIDELADLMMTSGKEVEISIARIAQKARACGIHLIVATQRPSVDVVTGLIKANLPSRISYKVGQKVDSKIILDSMGAESLLGRGDMLFTPPGVSGLIRLHAPWSDEKEIEEVAEFLKDQREANYDVTILKEQSEDGFANSGEAGDIGELDDLYEQAKMVVVQDKKSSISYLQRRLKIGYNRSATIIEQLEKSGVLSAPNAKGSREILV